MATLELSDVHASYGQIRAVQGASLRVEHGTICALVGSNGAGKTTILKTISGLLTPIAGEVRLDGRRIDHLRPHEIVALGISHAPEGRRIFSRMTVQENLRLGAFLRTDPAGVRADTDRVLSLFPRLEERLTQYAGTLSGGEQQMLAIGRALMARPRVLLLDEPSLGLAPILVQSIFPVLEEINRQGTTILLVEQNAHLALAVAHAAYVIQTGRIVLAGPAATLRENELVQRVYLGLTAGGG